MRVGSNVDIALDLNFNFRVEAATRVGRWKTSR